MLVGASAPANGGFPPLIPCGIHRGATDVSLLCSQQKGGVDKVVS